MNHASQSGAALSPQDRTGTMSTLIGRRILIVKLSSLGDILQASFMPKVIKQADDSAVVDWLVMGHCKAIVQRNPYVDRVVSCPDTKMGMLMGFVALVRGLRAAKYDVAIVAHRSPTISFLMWLAGIPVRLGFVDKRANAWLTDLVPFDTLVPMMQLNLRLLKRMNVSARPQDCALVYNVPPATVAPQERLPFIAIGPGGGKNKFSTMETKRWAHFDELILRLRVRYPTHGIVLLGDAYDSIAVESYKSLGDSRVTSICGKVDIEQSAAVLQSASCFIGNDSMLLYLSLSQQVRSIGIFGPTSGVFFTSGIPCASYLQARIGCSPCYNPVEYKNSLAFACPRGAECMVKDLNVDYVVDQVSQALGLSSAVATE